MFFTTTGESYDHKLRVAINDTVTVIYVDHTLPSPYNAVDELAITTSTLIGGGVHAMAPAHLR